MLVPWSAAVRCDAARLEVATAPGTTSRIVWAAQTPWRFRRFLVIRSDRSSNAATTHLRDYSSDTTVVSEKFDLRKSIQIASNYLSIKKKRWQITASPRSWCHPYTGDSRRHIRLITNGEKKLVIPPQSGFWDQFLAIKNGVLYLLKMV